MTFPYSTKQELRLHMNGASFSLRNSVYDFELMMHSYNIQWVYSTFPVRLRDAI